MRAKNKSNRRSGQPVTTGASTLAGTRALWLVLAMLLTACARMGNPDGGWYDDTPPHVVSATPADKATGVRSRKVTINFSEFIKIEDAQSKVIVSPPQLEQADIRAAGKHILIELKDTLKDNTTYTIDFSDAITDNNEGNPMGNYTFSFSTGNRIDTFEVSGYALDASNLEPIKGILVGLYSLSTDSALAEKDSTAHAKADSTGGQGHGFRTSPMVRVSRTNGSGRFTIKGVAPGSYNVYALQDNDGDYVYTQKSEMIGFSHEVVVPSAKTEAMMMLAVPVTDASSSSIWQPFNWSAFNSNTSRPEMRSKLAPR